MIAIIDYSAGNLFSVQNALNFLGYDNKITKDKAEIEAADKIILPGVGAFPDAVKSLKESGLFTFLKEQAQKKPFMGICLGMQMLFDKSFEFGETDGLGLINGTVELMTPPDLLIPQIGWNMLEKNNDCPLLNGIGDDAYVYFVHSYAAVCDYGAKVPALVFNGNVFGCQFHPEKSGETGLKILTNFAELH